MKIYTVDDNKINTYTYLSEIASYVIIIQIKFVIPNTNMLAGFYSVSALYTLLDRISVLFKCRDQTCFYSYKGYFKYFLKEACCNIQIPIFKFPIKPIFILSI